jgi:hypothetical protein
MLWDKCMVIANRAMGIVTILLAIGGGYFAYKLAFMQRDAIENILPRKEMDNLCVKSGICTGGVFLQFDTTTPLFGVNKRPVFYIAHTNDTAKRNPGNSAKEKDREQFNSYCATQLAKFATKEQQYYLSHGVYRSFPVVYGRHEYK